MASTVEKINTMKSWFNSLPSQKAKAEAEQEAKRRRAKKRK